MKLYSILILSIILSSCQNIHFDEHYDISINCELEEDPRILINEFLENVLPEQISKNFEVTYEEALVGDRNLRSTYLEQYLPNFIDESNIVKIMYLDKKTDSSRYNTFFEGLQYDEIYNRGTIFLVTYPLELLHEETINYNPEKLKLDFINKNKITNFINDILVTDKVFISSTDNDEQFYESVIRGHEQFHSFHKVNYFRDPILVDLSRISIEEKSGPFDRITIQLMSYRELIAYFAQIEYNKKVGIPSNIFDRKGLYDGENEPFTWYYIHFLESVINYYSTSRLYAETNQEDLLLCPSLNIIKNLFHEDLCIISFENIPIIQKKENLLYIYHPSHKKYIPLPNEMSNYCDNKMTNNQINKGETSVPEQKSLEVLFLKQSQQQTKP